MHFRWYGSDPHLTGERIQDHFALRSGTPSKTMEERNNGIVTICQEYLIPVPKELSGVKLRTALAQDSRDGLCA